MFTNHSPERELYESGGGKESMHGMNYQLGLLMVIYLRALSGVSEFGLATEMKKAGKFDDVIIRFVDKRNKRKYYRLLQIKHKSESTKSRISLSGLRSKSLKSDFGLLVYFNSFLKIKEEFANENEEIRDLIIYTNGDFKWGDRQEGFLMDDTFEKIKDDEDMIVKDELLQAELFRITKDSTVRQKWIAFLRENATKRSVDFDSDIELYLDKLCFAINQPGENELRLMTLKELEKYKIVDTDSSYKFFHYDMQRWMTRAEGCYLGRVDGLGMIKQLMQLYGEIEFGIEKPVGNFTGRKEEIQELREALEGGKDKVVISGLGGIGKSQLAKKFIEDIREEFDTFIWMKAECQEDLLRSLRRLAFDKLGIIEKGSDCLEKDIKSIIEEINQNLRQRRSIVVFDNVNNNDNVDGNNYLNDFLQKLTSTTFSLMTSRCQSWGGMYVLRLNELSLEDSIEMIRKSLGNELASDDMQVISLSNLVQNYPLALQQAVAFIKSKYIMEMKFGRTFGIHLYVKLFQGNSKTLLEKKIGKFNDDPYAKTTLTTWDVTLEHIRERDNGKLSEKILNIIAYFVPDGIQINDIEHCYMNENRESVELSLLLLDEFSMINFKNGYIAVHRLVQLITRTNLNEKGEEKAILDLVLSRSSNIEVNNTISILEYAVKYKDLLKYSHIPGEVIQKLVSEFRYEEGYLFGKKCLQKLKDLLDSTDENLIAAIDSLANVTLLHGKYIESYILYQDLYKRLAISFGEDHQKTIICKQNTAVTLIRLGRYDESLNILEALYKQRKREGSIDETDPDSLTTRHCMALSLRCLGRYDESLKIFQKVHEVRKRVLGEEHSDTLITRNQMAVVLHCLGKYYESLNIYDDRYEFQKRTLGELHLSTLNTRYNIGGVYRSLGRYDESLRTYEEVYEGRKRVLGEEHPDTLIAKNETAVLLQYMGKYEESLKIYEDVYECQKRVLGEEHPDSLNTRHNIGLGFRFLERFVESLGIFEEVCEVKKKVLGEEHPGTLISRNQMSLVLQCLEKYDESLSVYEEIYKCQLRILGETHPDSLCTRHNIAASLHYLEKYEEGLHILEAVYEHLKIVLGEENISTLTTKNFIAKVLHKLGRTDESRKQFEEVYSVMCKVSGVNHPVTVQCKKDLDEIFQN